MEITGSSSGESSSSSPPNSSTESLNDLKFDKKIYFEGVGLTAPRKSSSGSSSTSFATATPPKKVRPCPVQAAQLPRCQVEGCKVDLSDAKAYYSRHKVWYALFDLVLVLQAAVAQFVLRRRAAAGGHRESKREGEEGRGCTMLNHCQTERKCKG